MYMELTMKLFVQCVAKCLRMMLLARSTCVFNITSTVASLTSVLPGKFYCQSCDKHIDAKHFTRHTRDVHGTNNEVLCPICQKVFKNNSSCQKHLRVLHGVYRS